MGITACVLVLSEGRKSAVTNEIREAIERFDFVVQPADEFDQNDPDNRFVVWLADGKDKLSDDEALHRVGPDGFVMYAWRCPSCGAVVRKCEYPGRHQDDTYFGCSCPGTLSGVPISG